MFDCVVIILQVEIRLFYFNWGLNVLWIVQVIMDLMKWASFWTTVFPQLFEKNSSHVQIFVDHKIGLQQWTSNNHPPPTMPCLSVSNYFH